MTRILGPGLYERFPCPTHGNDCVEVIKISRQFRNTKFGKVDEKTRIEGHRAMIRPRQTKREGAA